MKSLLHQKEHAHKNKIQKYHISQGVIYERIYNPEDASYTAPYN